MAAKPILYYVLARGGWSERGFRIIGVTSEQRRKVYGRAQPSDVPTSLSARDVVYRFPEGTTAEFALAASDRAAKERAKHSGGIAQAQAKLDRLRAAQSLAILDAAKGLEPAGPQPTRSDEGPSC